MASSMPLSSDEIMANLFGDFSKSLATAASEFRKLHEYKTTKLQAHTTTTLEEKEKTKLFEGNKEDYIADPLIQETNCSRNLQAGVEPDCSNDRVHSTEPLNLQMTELVNCIKLNDMVKYKALLRIYKESNKAIQRKPELILLKADEAESIYESVVMYSLVSKVCLDLQDVKDSDNNIKYIKTAIQKLHMSERLIRVQDAKEVCCEIFHEIIEDLKKMNCILKKDKFKQIANCYLSIGRVLVELEMFQKAIDESKIGISIMDEEFGADKRKSAIYESLNTTVAMSYQRLKMFGKAVPYYEEALKVDADSTDKDEFNDIQNTSNTIALRDCKASDAGRF